MPGPLDISTIPRFSTDIERAYAAGFFDGEGHANFRSNGRDGSFRIVHAQIGQNTREILEWFQKYYGGGIYTYKSGKHKGAHQWSIVGTRACVFLMDIRPFLTVKRTQVDPIIAAAWNGHHAITIRERV